MSDPNRESIPDTERTATDEMADRYRNGAHIKPITGDPTESEPTGLSPGVQDSDKSPVDPF